ncbi:MAG: hypothetical protein ACUVT0_07020 [Thermochromatium sp.]
MVANFWLRPGNAHSATCCNFSHQRWPIWARRSLACCVPTVLRSRIQHMLCRLHGLVLAVGGSWHPDKSQNKQMLSVPRRKRAWFAGLWANASAPPPIPGLQGG